MADGAGGYWVYPGACCAGYPGAVAPGYGAAAVGVAVVVAAGFDGSTYWQLNLISPSIYN